MVPLPQGKDQSPTLESPRTSPLAPRPTQAISHRSWRRLFRNNRPARHTPTHIEDLSASPPQNTQSPFRIRRPTVCSSNTALSNNLRRPPDSPTASAPIVPCLLW